MAIGLQRYAVMGDRRVFSMADGKRITGTIEVHSVAVFLEVTGL
jgi:hypothetical protein